MEALGKAGDLEKLNAKQREELMKIYRAQDGEWTKLNAKVQQHLAAKPKAKMTKVQVTSEGFKPTKHHADGRGFPHFYKQIHFLKRGDPNQKQYVASQSFLQVLMRSGKEEVAWQETAPKNWRTSYRRRALANWMTDTRDGAGHLLARVIVNRLWLHHLGRGIVATPNDFGVQGIAPTHPELLDWLAQRLIAGGWQLKPIHKLIVLSAVYGQDSAYSEAKAKVDVENQLLWRRTPRRLEAEVIRDSLLQVSGQLDRTMYGPGTLNEGMKRRSIYFMIKRSKLIPSMQLFDSPEPLVSQGKRPATIIAPQALMFMNNPQLRTYATTLAAKLSAAGDTAKSITLGYRLTLGRPPTATELKASQAFIDLQSASYQKAGRKDAGALALTDFTQVLFGLNEFVYMN